MKNYILIFFTLLSALMVTAQEDQRKMIRGQVLFKDTNVPNQIVYNSTTEEGTTTDKDGRFAINVKLDDQLIFTSVNYELMVFNVTQEILDKNRLVVDVNEKITELGEVVVTPEDQEKFLELKNEKFKEFEYEIDRSSEVKNVAYLSQNDRIDGRLNFKNIFKAIVNNKKKSEEEDDQPFKVSEVMRHVYDDRFFVEDLKIPQDEIDAFLVYCDDKIDTKNLLRKENEFQLIDILVTHSKEFKASLEEE